MLLTSKCTNMLVLTAQGSVALYMVQARDEAAAKFKEADAELSTSYIT